MIVHSDQKSSKNSPHSGSLKQALRHSNNCIPVLPLADLPQLIHNHLYDISEKNIVSTIIIHASESFVTVGVY